MGGLGIGAYILPIQSCPWDPGLLRDPGLLWDPELWSPIPSWPYPELPKPLIKEYALTHCRDSKCSLGYIPYLGTVGSSEYHAPPPNSRPKEAPENLILSLMWSSFFWGGG